MRGKYVAADAAPTRQVPGGASSSAIAAEAARLRAENARLRKQLDEGGDIAFWSAALLSEVAEESADERRIFCLKSELCRLVACNRRSAVAARARHAALERLFGSIMPSGAHVEAALVDGGAEVMMSAAARVGASTSVSMELALEAEQKLSGLGQCVDGLSVVADAHGGDRSIRELRDRITARAAALRVEILESAAEMPAAQAQLAASSRRYIHRSLSGSSAKASLADRTGRAVLTPPCAGSMESSTHLWQQQLPEGLVNSWRKALEEAGDETQGAHLRPMTSQGKAALESASGPPLTTKACVAQMVEHVAAWASQLQAAKDELADSRAAASARQRPA